MAKSVEKLAQDLESGLVPIVSGLLKGAEADLQGYCREIAATIVLAMSSNRPDLLEESKAQLTALAELHRLKALGARDAAVGVVVGQLMDLAFKAGSSS